ncbi:uncharacterized protein Nmag_3564 [Natrialba magadii ATCC 43099]|uniref:DUF5518 domain-containing protein n=1 Tax=Natrialba magadii (strain ATCC 43099 / DSM 3394 / CCM 3739 / CIP 104546 / IAM 13178 / JCM 8861 / NBRC 102185 / NCIMB 2190 / MS3) TaxID=547559 RepID=D3SU25_NATMM|nr:DUF5518 domain-containing protein [Natrialba magadii]ADD07114.1 uncharacterized protein Nmag_3564 [Natrialba magadii ATCC 43099]
MTPLSRFRKNINYGQFRTAVLLGIASIPFTFGINWVLTPDPVSATPLFIASIISGYLYQSHSIKGTHVGVVTGLTGGIPIVLWQSGATVVDWWGHSTLVDAVGDSWLMAISSVGAGVATFGLLTIVMVVIGVIGGFIGEWMNNRIDRTHTLRSEA